MIDAKSGLQAATERIVEYLKAKSKTGFLYYKQTRPGKCRFFRLSRRNKNNSGLNLVPITIPADEGEKFSGVIDLLLNQQYNYNRWRFPGVKGQLWKLQKNQMLKTYHNSLIESIVETNDDLLNKYLEGEKIEASSINEVLKSAVTECKVVPVFATSSGKNIGVDIIMDYINSLMPSPLEIKPLASQRSR